MLPGGVMASNSPGLRLPADPTLMAPLVEPWYWPLREIILVFCGLPEMYWYCRAIFRAISTASEPPPQKNDLVMSPGASSASLRDSRIPGMLLYAPELL